MNIKRALKLIRWKYLLLVAWFGFWLMTLGKLSASYEGCMMIGTSFRIPFLLGICLLFIGVPLWIIKKSIANFFIMHPVYERILKDEKPKQEQERKE